jgi:hypothetical protein
MFLCLGAAGFSFVIWWAETTSFSLNPQHLAQCSYGVAVFRISRMTSRDRLGSILDVLEGYLRNL